MPSPSPRPSPRPTSQIYGDASLPPARASMNKCTFLQCRGQRKNSRQGGLRLIQKIDEYFRGTAAIADAFFGRIKSIHLADRVNSSRLGEIPGAFYFSMEFIRKPCRSKSTGNRSLGPYCKRSQQRMITCGFTTFY